MRQGFFVEVRLLYITDRLTDVLATDLKAGAVQLVGGGLEFMVFRAESPALGPLAIRVPRQRWFENDNDERLDAHALLRQEAVLAAHAGTHGLPVPAVHALHLSEDVAFLASAFVESDGTAPTGQDMGKLAKVLHRCPLPDIPLAAQPGPLGDVLSERLLRRVRVVERLSGMEAGSITPMRVRRLLSWQTPRPALLHMDFRPANLLTRGGHIVAVLDWSNALVGDPALELARIAEYGHLDRDFLAGYGVAEPFAHLPPGLELLYRLDTAAMLAVVFLSEAPDPEQARQQVRRVQTLLDALRPHIQ